MGLLALSVSVYLGSKEKIHCCGKNKPAPRERQLRSEIERMGRKMWSVETGVVKHPSGKGFAIEVMLKYDASSYKALVMEIGQNLKAIPRGYEKESSLALCFDGLLGYFNAKKALADVETVFGRRGLGGLWPRCINCLNFLSTGDGRLKTRCGHCGYDNPW